jgi:hypothetical protein
VLPYARRWTPASPWRRSAGTNAPPDPEAAGALFPQIEMEVLAPASSSGGPSHLVGRRRIFVVGAW